MPAGGARGAGFRGRRSLRFQHLHGFRRWRQGLDADEFRQRLAFNQLFYFAGVQYFALQQGFGDADQKSWLVESMFLARS